MRADTELFKDKIEVSLDGRQVFYLFFGGAVIASLVFVLGVMVGKRVEARAYADGRPATSAAYDPLAALDQLSQRDERVLSSAIAPADTRIKAEPALAADEPRAPAQETESASSAAAGKAAKAAAAKAAAAKAAAAKAAPAKAAPAKKPAAERAAATPAKDNTARRQARFTLQLSSFRDRAEADSFHSRLKQAGYTPYVVKAEVPDKGTWYRVRLGEYDSYEAAIDAKKEFEASQRIIAYVTRIRS